MAEIDLDAARAARAETNGEGHTLTFGGEKFELPPECPVEFALGLADGDIRGAIAALLGEGAERFFAHKPSNQDVIALTTQVAEVYGLGEAEASGGSDGSSESTSGRSRRTSKGSTPST